MMKKKAPQQKKLLLGRETLRALSMSQRQLEQAAGGQVNTWTNNDSGREDCICESGQPGC